MVTDTKQKAEPKLSERRGVWKNRWFAFAPIHFDDGDVGPTGAYIGWTEFPTERDARSGALTWKAGAKTQAGISCIYLGPVWLPGDEQ